MIEILWEILKYIVVAIYLFLFGLFVWAAYKHLHKMDLLERNAEKLEQFVNRS